MATGITSIAASLLEMRPVALILLYVNYAAFAILVIMLLVRLVRFFQRALADLNDHVRGPGFFTIVAATCVMGSQLIIVTGTFEARFAKGG